MEIDSIDKVKRKPKTEELEENSLSKDKNQQQITQTNPVWRALIVYSPSGLGGTSI